MAGFFIVTNTSNGKDVQTYIRLVYLCHFYIRVYKRNSTKSLLLQYILFVLIYHGLYSILVTLL